MSEPLATYLHDHLAGSMYAIDLVDAIAKRYSGEPLGEFAAELSTEIKADRDTLRKLSEKIGAGSSGLKEMAAWMGEKVSRLKLNHAGVDSLGTFEAIEFLALGIHGKQGLWEALSAVQDLDVRLQGMDFENLAERAESQYAKVEERRLELARITFRPGASQAAKGGNA